MRFWIFLALGVLVVGSIVMYRTPQEPSKTGTLGDVSLTLEYALSQEEKERGLSGREDIPENYGMLFVFPKDDTYGFWMKDTLVPLDIFWLDSKGQVIHIEKDVATSTYPTVFYPDTPARYVLETAAGFATLHNIDIGAQLDLKNWPTVSK
jgi:hypothetical protein